VGAALVRISAGAALMAAVVVYLIALPFLLRGRSPADEAVA
jgi:hypothetical protein